MRGPWPIRSAARARSRSKRPCWGATWLPERAARLPQKTGPRIPKRLWHEARTEAQDAALRGGTLSIVGSDIDETSLSMARRHARNAAVEADIRFERRPFSDGVPQGDYGCLICNPPYGERSGDVADAEDLARQAADGLSAVRHLVALRALRAGEFRAPLPATSGPPPKALQRPHRLHVLSIPRPAASIARKNPARRAPHERVRHCFSKPG